MSDFAQTWRKLPVDGVAYIDVDEMLAMSDGDLKRLVETMRFNRYSLDGWRNWNNLWRIHMHGGLEGRRILDYGCGVGLEALELSKIGAQVGLSDINPESVQLATRVLNLHGFEPLPEGPVDVFYANGVLHHVPDAAKVLAAYAAPLVQEFRLMVYTDKAEEARGSVPLGTAMDFSGVYADWYDRDKLQSICPEGWYVRDWTYITSNGHYAAARVTR